MEYLTNIFFVLLITIITMKLYNEQQKIIIMLDVANANLRIDDLLTLNARNYIITGNKKYREQYFMFSAIRDGSGVWDKLLKYPWFKDKTATMDDLYDMLDLDENDTKPLKRLI